MEEQNNTQAAQPAQRSHTSLIIGIAVAVIAVVMAVVGYYYLYARPLQQEN